MQDGDEGDEDEDDAWVRQQLQKAGAASFARAPQQPSGGGGGSGSRDMGRMPAHAQATTDPGAQAAAAAHSVMVSLQEGLRRLQEKQQHVERQQKQTKANLAHSLQVGGHPKEGGIQVQLVMNQAPAGFRGGSRILGLPAAGDHAAGERCGRRLSEVHVHAGDAWLCCGHVRHAPGAEPSLLPLQAMVYTCLRRACNVSNFLLADVCCPCRYWPVL